MCSPIKKFALAAIAIVGCIPHSWSQTPTPGDGTNYTWAATSVINAPIGRSSAAAVWTGSEMIVWGGTTSAGSYLNTGGRYNPTTDSWTATSTTNTPEGLIGHTAVWTGHEMVVWGGFDGSFSVNTGRRYDPGTDSWVATSTTNAPAALSGHTAVWTGSEMIVWGGYAGGSYVNTGARYNPVTDSWTAISSTKAPVPRAGHQAIWTGSKMIVWGGGTASHIPFTTGGIYDPVTDSWRATSTADAPHAFGYKAVWTGDEMLVWGGFIYDLSIGSAAVSVNVGGRYNPIKDSWTATDTLSAPKERYGHTAVWTGSEMIVWGGHFARSSDYSALDTGGEYKPDTNSWTATSATNPPHAREAHAAIWTGNKMIVWGGNDLEGNYFNSGGTYGQQPQLPTPTPGSTAQALNISTRMRVDTGSNALIGGFIIIGTAPKNVAVRGIGPSLSAFGVPDALADPILELRDSSNAVISENDDWQSDPDQAARLTKLNLALPDPKESGLVTTVQPGSYTAVLAGKNQTTGTGLVEIYDTSAAAASELGNISTRGSVLNGNNVMIGGFILGGSNNTHVVVRGIGPSLGQFGIPNTLADPTLELHDANGVVLVSNDNWQDEAATAAQLAALGLDLRDTTESGIYTSLTPGAFTAILAGKNSNTGVGLLEIYNFH